MIELRQHYNQLYTRIRQFEKQYQKKDQSVLLLAVSKTRTISEIKALYDLGQRQFGENYLQEALPKIKALPKDIDWHFIGQIQANKTRAIAENFTWVHTLASIKVAERLNRQCPAKQPALNVCIQINTSEELSKGGIAITQVVDFAHQIMCLKKLKLRGLMSIPKGGNHFAAQRAQFAKLNQLKGQLANDHILLDILSMGMSNDMEAAIAENANIVRIGTALFGVREGKNSEKRNAFKSA